MGNLLCIPKSKNKRRSRDSNKEKSFKKWPALSKEEKDHICIKTTASNEPVLPARDRINRIDGICEQEPKQCSTHHVTSATPEVNFHIEPVVSSSILLKHFDEDIGDDKEIEEAPEKSGESEDLQKPDDSVDIEKGSLSVSKEPQTATVSESFKEHTTTSIAEEDEPVTQLDSSDKDSYIREATVDIQSADKETLLKSKCVSSEALAEEIDQINEEENTPSVEKVHDLSEAVEINDEVVRFSVELGVEKTSCTREVCPKIIQVKPCIENQLETHCVKKNLNDEVEPAMLSFQKKAAKGVLAHSFDNETLARADNTDIGSCIETGLARKKPTTYNLDSRSVQKSIAYDQNLIKKNERDTQNTRYDNLNDAKIEKVPGNHKQFRTSKTDLVPKASKTEDIQKEKVNLKETYSCPVLPKTSKATAQVRELAKVLEVLSAISVPLRNDAQKSAQSQSFSRNVSSPQPTTSDLANRHGYYKSDDGIQKWMKDSVSDGIDPVKIDKPKQDDLPKRKVSDFEVPKKAARKPKAPLSLKKPMPHLFSLPNIAKTDLEDDKNVKWTQKDIKGPQTDVLWSSKPTSYDVKFPSLPTRLLDREGSIEKMRDDLVLPQTKQIETLKREYGRFPGLKVPQTLKDKYSFDVQVQNSPNMANGAEKGPIRKNDDGVGNETDDKGIRNVRNM